MALWLLWSEQRSVEMKHQLHSDSPVLRYPVYCWCIHSPDSYLSVAVNSSRLPPLVLTRSAWLPMIATVLEAFSTTSSGVTDGYWVNWTMLKNQVTLFLLS